MDLILKIMGGVFCAFLSLIALMILAFRVFKSRLFRMAEQMAGAGENLTPPRLHLEPAEEPEWNDRAAVDGLARPLLDLGFQDAGSYEADEIAGLRLRALVKPQEALTAIIYEFSKAGVWMDMATRYEDGSALTYTTTKEGRELDQRPGHGKVFAPGEDPAVLYRRMLAERTERPFQTITTSDFARVFEEAYAEEIDWRNSRGGPTLEEVRAVLEASGETVSEEQVQATQEVLAQQAMFGLDVALSEKFMAQTTLSVAEWERVEDRLLFIHDRLTREMVRERFSQYLYNDEEEEPDEEPETEVDDLPGDMTPRQVFQALNERLPPGRRFEHLGVVVGPVEADAYAAPE